MEFLSVFLLFVFSTHSVVSAAGTLGINYGRLADNLPSPPEVVQLLKSNGITKAKIFNTDSTVLSAFSGSGISLTVALPNDQLSAAGGGTSFTDEWVQSNILPYLPNTLIDAIAVGNEVFSDKSNNQFLVPAIRNIYASLAKHDVASSIKVSSPMALSALQKSYPASAGSFNPDIIEPVIKPILDFLKQTDSYLMVNAYPFFAYSAEHDTIPLDYALGNSNAAGNRDPNNGLVYTNILDAQIDAVFAAMAAVGFNDVKIVVTETGWPSIGGESEFGASVDNAKAYNGNLARRVLTGGGTPLRPNEPLNVYLFALFNENNKPGATSERNYGLFYPNQQRVYDIPLSLKDIQNSPVLNEGSKAVVTAGQTWCVANENAGEKKLQEALDYACGQGGADCRPIQPGATCYDPNTLVAHASYALNSYYQKNARGSGTCHFGGAAYVVTNSPKFGSCEFPAGN